MLVKEKTVLSPEFRAWIRDLMKQKGLSVNALALVSELHQSTLNAGLLGERNIPNENLKKIAPHLGLEPEHLVARADFDRIGGLERIRRDAPEALGYDAAIVNADGTMTLVEVKKPVRLLGSRRAHPPTADEQALLDEALAIGLGLHAPFTDPGFWDRDSGDELRTEAFGLLRENVRIVKQMRGGK